MAITQTVNSYHFERAFVNAGRGNQFSYDALQALYEYLESLSDDLGEDIELDVIALCCEWQESTIAEIIDQYDIDVTDCLDDDDRKEIVVKYLEDNTTMIDLDNDSILFIQF